MTVILQYLFWLCVLIIAYVYIGYPLLLIALSKLRPAPRVQKAAITPTVSVIIPAYNEEEHIAAKLKNAMALDYPKDRIEVIVGSDGSTDATNAIVELYREHGVEIVALEINQGKSAAENAAVAASAGEILFFTDANVKLRADALRQIAANFADPQVGCVVGQVTYSNQQDTSVSQGEGVYWRYELWLRRKESEVGNLAMASGPIMAVRRSLFQPLNPDVGEDFVLPIQVALKGFRVLYEPKAVSEELLFQNTPASMHRSKVRIISKDLRGLFVCRAIWNPLRRPLHVWGLVSHKLLRWLVPYFLFLLLIANLFLLGKYFYQLALAAQLAVYGLAVLGYVWQRKSKPPRVVSIPFSFCLVNLAALVGVASFLLGRKSGKWIPVRGR